MMKIYFKSGNKVRVSTSIGRELIKMIKDRADGDENNLLIKEFKINKIPVELYNIDNIEAIK